MEFDPIPASEDFTFQKEKIMILAVDPISDVKAEDELCGSLPCRGFKGHISTPSALTNRRFNFFEFPRTRFIFRHEKTIRTTGGKEEDQDLMSNLSLWQGAKKI